MKIWLPTIRARSGADVYTRRLASALRARGVDAIVQWFPHASQYIPWGLRLVRPPPGVDIIDANSWFAFAFRHDSIPLVATVLHCVAGHGYPGWKSLPQAIFHDHLIRRYERASLRTADAVVAISNSTSTEVREDYGVSRVHTIPLWIDTRVFSPNPRTKKVRQARTRVLIVGNMSRRKGGDLITPFCNALGGDFEVSVVAGLRGEHPAVSAQGAGLQFTSGLTSAQLVAAYRNADIVVSLSRHEGFGYTALEGMSCGKPIVSFNVSGLRDVIADGETGFLIPAEDVVAMAAACHRLREDGVLARCFGELGRERAITVFSEDVAIDAHLRLYSDLLLQRGLHA